MKSIARSPGVARELRSRIDAAASAASDLGGAIRITGMSLVAVGAVALGLLLARQRHDRLPSEKQQLGEQPPAVIELDAIRSAGF